MKKISRFAAILVLGVLSTAPLIASAQKGVDLTLLKKYKTGIVDVVNTVLLPVLVAAAFITFLYGVYKYFIYGADDEAERATGRQFVLWGVIGFVIIFGVWALVNIVSGTLGFPAGGGPKFAPPTI